MRNSPTANRPRKQHSLLLSPSVRLVAAQLSTAYGEQNQQTSGNPVHGTLDSFEEVCSSTLLCTADKTSGVGSAGRRLLRLLGHQYQGLTRRQEKLGKTGYKPDLDLPAIFVCCHVLLVWKASQSSLSVSRLQSIALASVFVPILSE